MTTTYSSNLALALQGVGDNINTWGTTLNTGVFTIIDQVLGSKTTISSITGGTTTLNTAQSQYLYYNLTGTLTSNSIVVFPASSGRIIFVKNATSGSYTLTVEGSGGSGLIIPQGTTVAVLIDSATGNAFNAANSPVNFEVALASATTTDLGSVGSNVINVTGTTTITGFGSSATTSNCIYYVRFSGALVLTYNATSLILPGLASITTAAGDVAIMKYEGSGNWRCISYQAAAGTSIQAINIQRFSASGTYTPTANMTYCIMEAWGGGGAGGGVAGSVGQAGGGGGGGAGGYGRRTVTASTVGVSQTITIGAGGTPGAAGSNNGGNGGNTTIGSLLTANGGGGGGGSSGGVGGGGFGGTSNGDLPGQGQQGTQSLQGSPSSIAGYAGNGGSSLIGSGGITGATANGVYAGAAASGYASGGGGASSNNSTSTAAGGAGTGGYVLITEFIGA